MDPSKVSSALRSFAASVSSGTSRSDAMQSLREIVANLPQAMPAGSRKMNMGDTEVVLTWSGPITEADLQYAAGELGEPEAPGEFEEIEEG